MGVPVWTVGQVLLAGDVNSWFVPLAAVKSADQSVTSSTALVNDTDLLVPVAASATYVFLLTLHYDGGTQGSSDLKLQWAVPAGTLMRWTSSYRDTSGNNHNAPGSLESSNLSCGTNGAGTTFGVASQGTVIVSSTAGNLQLQWAQNTSSGTATKVHQYSSLIAWRVA